MKNRNRIPFYITSTLTVYIFYWLNYQIMNSKKLEFIIFLTVISTIITFYTTYIISTLIQLLLITINDFVKIERYIVYPFVYDSGKVSFIPIKILESDFSVKDPSPLNLQRLFTSEKDLNKISRMYLQIFFLKKLSNIIALLTSVIILFLLNFQSYLIVNFTLIIVLTFILYTILFEYKILSTNKSIRTIEIYKRLLIYPYNKCIKSNIYNIYLNKYFASKDNDMLFIMDNYLSLLLEDNDEYIDVDMFGRKIYETENRYNFTNDIMLMHLKRKIGFVGIHTNRKDMVNLSVQLLEREIDYFTKISEETGIHYSSVIVSMIKYINFLKNTGTNVLSQRHLFVDNGAIFNDQKRIVSIIEKRMY